MEEGDNSFVQVFVEEAMEHLADMEQSLLGMERDGAHVNQDLVNRVFRATHTIKGSAGYMGFTRIQTLAHKMEDVLGLIRKGQLVPNPENINQLLLSFDTLKQMAANPAASLDYDITHHLEGLSAVVEGAGTYPTEGPSVPAAPGEWAAKVPDTGAVVTATPEAVSDAVREGKNLYLIRTEEEGALSEAGLAQRLKRYGTVLSVTPFTAESGQSVHYILFACVLASEDLLQLAAVTTDHVWIVGKDGTVRAPLDGPGPFGMKDASAPPQETSPEAPSIPQPRPCSDTRQSVRPTSSAAVSSPLEAPTLKEPRADARIAPPSSVRVKLSLLDRLMNMAGELVLSRNQLLQGISGNDPLATEMAAKSVNAITSELQETVMLTRMQPVGTLFNRFNRLVRDLARELGKEVELEMTGKEVELDRTLLENLSDPLTHLLRNAVDHGIEPVDERRRLGKGEAGRIRLGAFHQAGQITIEISDDGRGLDPDSIAVRAVNMGYVTQEQVALMGPKEKTNLIFQPGFTTSDTVSSISGRGVGMDVVKNNINRLGGQIDVYSQVGLGMSVRIKLPLTMAIIAGQVVSVEDQTFILPQTNIEELLRIPADQVKHRLEWVGDAQVVRLRDRLLPLIRLTDLLGIQRTYAHALTTDRKPDRRQNIADRRSRKIQLFGSKPDNGASPPEERRISTSRFDRRRRSVSALNIAVLSTGLLRYGLIVDRFHDAEEIVVKPLGRHLKSAHVYAGATILGNGQVALILDAGNMAQIGRLHAIEAAERSPENSESAGHSNGEAVEATELLTFRNDPGERFAVPLSEVLRIEKIETSVIETYGKRKSIPYRGGNLPIFSVDEVAEVRPLSSVGDHTMVIVCAVAGRQVGLLARGPVDAARAPIDHVSLKQAGIQGSVIINRQTALVVDLHQMIQHLYPEWIRKEGAGEILPVARGAILVVEDSAFFRSQIRSLLERKGYTVLEAEDGGKGWELLLSRSRDIDMVITDIEMPRMNGLELAKKIREHGPLSDMPIIALTTLADDEDAEKGKTAGIDDYQIKLDKGQLLESIERLLEEKRRELNRD